MRLLLKEIIYLPSDKKEGQLIFFIKKHDTKCGANGLKTLSILQCRFILPLNTDAMLRLKIEFNIFRYQWLVSFSI